MASSKEDGPQMWHLYVTGSIVHFKRELRDALNLAPKDGGRKAFSPITAGQTKRDSGTSFRGNM